MAWRSSHFSTSRLVGALVLVGVALFLLWVTRPQDTIHDGIQVQLRQEEQLTALRQMEANLQRPQSPHQNDRPVQGGGYNPGVNHPVLMPATKAYDHDVTAPNPVTTTATTSSNALPPFDAGNRLGNGNGIVVAPPVDLTQAIPYPKWIQETIAALKSRVTFKNPLRGAHVSEKSWPATKIPMGWDRATDRDAVEGWVDCPLPCSWGIHKEDHAAADVVLGVFPGGRVPSKSKPKQLRAMLSWESKGNYAAQTRKGFREGYDVFTSFDWDLNDRDLPCTYIEEPEYVFRKPPVLLEDKNQDTLISWFSSRCQHEHRMNFVADLKKFIKIDSYGRCHNNAKLDKKYPQCKVGKSGWQNYGEKDCVISKYKFSLAVENSIEVDYITEKLWGVFKSGSVPVYWGGTNVDQYLPSPTSIVNVADFNGDVKALADYLIRVGNDPELYGRHLAWKSEAWSAGFRRALFYSYTNLYCNLCLRAGAVHAGVIVREEATDFQN
eukprot:TRINITY_DN12705_c0_g1_i1.p1 TRINITY_DN12705_c0_g1~~TRINITY_DN12705_c0_g1_i1.p1  ORF type:complete len:494 (+),score=79.87 TRINITY_DN12705_c0_g1_i1:396-1877(+)